MIMGLLKFIFLVLLGALASCNPIELQPQNSRSGVVINDGSLDGMAYIYEDSPYILDGPDTRVKNVRMENFLDIRPRFITSNSSLTGNCSMMFQTMNVTIEDCILPLSKESDPPQALARRSDRTYIFAPDSEEFYQVNSLYHISKATNLFLKKLGFAYNEAQKIGMYNLPKSIPEYLKDSKLFWYKAISNTDSKLFKFDHLTSYSQCELDGNASFSPAGPTLCFGGVKEYPGFYFIQDPSVIYHELGHAFISIMMNLRNGTEFLQYHPFRSNLGSFGYDEAGSIGEGVSDYFSFMMNKRETFGEFALGKIYKQSRPLTERNHLHKIPGLAETSSGRLSYPQYLLYDPNNPDEIYEDVHYSGQIVSHYLVALTKAFKTNCNYKNDKDGGHDRATSLVMLLLAETLSELGDLFGKGIDSNLYPNDYFTNLDEINSYLWTQYNNPITFRRFFQVFAKNINRYISYFNPPLVGLCTGFDKNKSEKLLDDYGLLLFKTYNDDGTSTKDRSVSYSFNLTSVSEENRRKSILISKELLDLSKKTETHPTRVGFYIIDNSTDMDAVLKELLYKGFTVPISSNVAGTNYNNNNIKISPGEILGLIPNLLNKSNSTMAGVQILATDWDHVHITDTQSGNFKPCVIDNITTVEQGGEEEETCVNTDPDYKRLLKDPVTMAFPTSAAAPVCMVLLEDQNQNTSRWVSQNEYRKKQGLTLMDKDCLGFTSSPNTDEDFSFNPHECLVRFLPGGQDAFFSKIDPQKNYYESVLKESKDGQFNLGNVLLMEVNKWIPPGTKFRCRLRARFSNCSDCYTDGTNNNDDFIDAEYNGHKPFKVINFEFEVHD